MEVLLSISVLVSDRLETVEKCLDSLVPVLKAVPSELIVVSTGKNSESLEIAKKYTENIIFFDWCDDFSKARNTGLDIAVGEWFMYIDDDEWFENCSEIIEFFLSGEYKSYRSARYIVRNYFELNGRSYSDVSVGRMVKREANTRFEGIIHEALSPRRMPEKYFKAYVHHYGYVKDNQNKESDKNLRNIPLLIKQIGTDPDEIRYRAQLVQEYIVIGDNEQAELECRKILDLKENQWSDGYVHLAAILLILSLINQKKWKEAFSEGEALLYSGQLRELYILNLSIYLLQACVELKKYEEGISIAQNYIHVKEQMDADPDSWNWQQLLNVNRDNTLKYSSSLYANAIRCCAYEEEYQAMELFIKGLFDLNGTNENDIGLLLDSVKAQFPDNEEQILGVFERIESDKAYVVLQKALLNEQRGELKKLETLYSKCQPEADSICTYQLILISLRHGFSLPAFVHRSDLEEWSICAQKVAEHYNRQGYLLDKRKVDNLFSAYPVQKLVLWKKILARYMYIEKTGQNEFIDLIYDYCKTVLELNHLLYRNEMFEDAMQFCLPKECRAALSLQHVLDIFSNGSASEIISSLKDFVGKYNDLSYIAERLTDYASKNLVESTPKAVSNEFVEMGNGVKAIMKQLADAEKYKEALEVAERLSILLPDDLEVIKYKQLLQKMV